MSGQEQKDIYDPTKPKSVATTYTGPKKLDAVKDLLGDMEGLISKENLAKNYKQSGGQ